MTERIAGKRSWEQTTAKSTERLGAGPRLVLMWGEQARSIELPPRGRFVIGRAEDADVRVEHGSISRRHALVTIGDGMTVEDLGSANGTLLDGLELAPHAAVPLRDGALLEMAGVLVVVQSGTAGEGPSSDDPSGVDPVMREVLEHIDIAARSTLSVILLGETGVGKEVLASRVHRTSPRASAPFLKVNCAALVESLLEAELFGYERGAFTGAAQSKAGLLEAAHMGTVFLDEVGELPLSIQAKLLRVLESGEVTRVGGIKPRLVDVRFVGATNRDLARQVAAGAFRQDLYFRLDGVSIHVPPLRERSSEILPLARMFVREACVEAGRAPLEIATSAAALLLGHSWPGNVRELRNVVRRSVVFCRGAALEATDLRFDGAGAPPRIAPPMPAPAPASTRAAGPTGPSSTADANAPPSSLLAPSARRRLEAQHDREHIVLALEQCGGNQTRAAELLGISRRTLVNRLADLNLPRPRKRPREDA